jgi:hypothetical protein
MEQSFNKFLVPKQKYLSDALEIAAPHSTVAKLYYVSGFKFER